MYQYSLAWFIALYMDTFDKAEKSKYVKQRVESVIQFATYSIYANVCRGLFEKDKLLFAFLLLVRILDSRRYIDSAELAFLISPAAGGSHAQPPPSNNQPELSWIPTQVWGKIWQLQHISAKFKGITDSFMESNAEWRKIYFDTQAHIAKFPSPFHTCSQMQRLCILKALRPDKLIRAVQEFVR